MKPVDLLPGARSDFDESFDWYAERSVLAAERFELAVDDALRRIAANPEKFAFVTTLHQACRVERFPFRVIYQVEPERIVVVAIAHAKRRPNYWKRRKPG
jgi:plasmid stabilization system protein ParE